MRFVLASLFGAVLGGAIGLVGPFVFAFVIHSGQAPLNFFWTTPLGLLLGLAGGLIYARVRRNNR